MELLLCTKDYVWCSINIIPANSYNKPVGFIPLSPGHWELEGLTNLPKVTQLVSGKNIGFNPNLPCSKAVCCGDFAGNMVNIHMKSWFCNSGLILQFSTLAYWTSGPNNSLLRGHLCTVGCLAASLASTSSMPIAPSPCCDNQKCLQILPRVPRRQYHPQLRTSIIA